MKVIKENDIKEYVQIGRNEVYQISFPGDTELLPIYIVLEQKDIDKYISEFIDQYLLDSIPSKRITKLA